MDENQKNLDLLGLLHYIYAGLHIFFGCFPLIYVVMGVAMISGALPEKSNQADAEVVGWFFTAIGIIIALLIWGIAILIFMAGRFLKQRRGHTFCIVISALNCMNMPLGTALGIFTIINLVKPEVKALFEQKVSSRKFPDYNQPDASRFQDGSKF